jgi:hypothetical protein
LAESLLSVIDVMTREVDRLTKHVLDEVRVEPVNGRRSFRRSGHLKFPGLAVKVWGR